MKVSQGKQGIQVYVSDSAVYLKLHSAVCQSYFSKTGRKKYNEK